MKRKHFITAGTFDGMHLGHRALFTRLEQLAVKYQMAPLVLYFAYPPKTILSPRPEMSVLTTPPEKKALLKAALSVSAQELNFQAYREYSAEQFFKKVLLEKYHCGGILAGPDFAFGKNRQGDGEFLKRKCAQLDLPFEICPLRTENGGKISSSLIRKTLAQGDVPRANALLGRRYSLQGRVVEGQKLGRKLGFPTANLDINYYKLLPLGVFAVKVRVGHGYYRGVCNIGFRPTVNTIHSSIPLAEVHILDFHRSIYGRRIEVWFYDKLRGETKFDGLDALKEELARNCQAARQIIPESDLHG